MSVLRCYGAKKMTQRQTVEHVKAQHQSVPQVLPGCNATLISDPFADISFPARHQTAQIHISSRLTLLRSPVGSCGDWISFSDVWYRRLTANAFLCLRDAVLLAIKKGTLADEYQNAPQVLEFIAEIGIKHGAFTQDEITLENHAPEWYSFHSDIPRWADDY